MVESKQEQINEPLQKKNIDNYILKESKTRQKNVAMTWIDYKNAYDMALQTWIIKSVDVENIRQNQKLRYEYHEKLEGGIDSERSNPIQNKNSKKHLPERLTFTTSNDATMLYRKGTRKINLQTY